MRVLFDTNVVLDVLLPRQEWFAHAKAIWQANERGELEAFVTASSLTDVYYVARRIVGYQRGRAAVRLCLDALAVLETNEAVLDLAWSLEVMDFEDAVQIVSAERGHLDAIITRDSKGFTGSPIPVLTPMDLIARLETPT
jgi:predicted nucleic acid-binding protein